MRILTFHLIWPAFALLLVACDDGDPVDPTGDPCVPGRTELCACPGGESGVRACSVEGFFEACTCSGSVDGGLLPDMSTPTPDMSTPTPDMSTPTPDMSTLDPDARLPGPDAGPDLDAGQPGLDTALPDPDIGPGSDADLLDPDVGPESDADLPDLGSDVGLPDPDAALPAVCGDQLVDPGEECDDGNLIPGDGCDEECLLEPICGDGEVEDEETCDDGNLIPGDGCSPTCTVEICGNLILDVGEGCDDGNLIPGDGCSPQCAVEGCGNGILDPGEQCDDGNAISADGCSAGCTNEICGNGLLDAGEQCDDGNRLNGDGCNGNCDVERCGNSVIDAGELCDDGNPVSGDGCSALCQLEICGNATIDVGEECDDGNPINGDGCNSDCAVERCGNHRIDIGEACDDGNVLPNDGCNAVCQIEGCGDGIINGDEACDDGNNIDGDGCTANCRTERCGNAIVNVGEECDDGNNIDGDGCSTNCEVEVNDDCGNGVIDDLEICDDGNQVNGDGCDTLCTGESFQFITGLEIYSGAIPADQLDTIYFTADDHARFTALIDNQCDNDLQMAVYSREGNVPLIQGDPCAEIQGQLEPGDYRLELSSDQVVDFFRVVLLLEVEMEFGGTYQGRFPAEGSDYFEFVLAEPGSVTLYTTADNGCLPDDTVMALYLRGDTPLASELIAENDDVETQCSRIIRDLQPGTYRVNVRGYQQRAIDTYTITLEIAGCGDGFRVGDEECDDGNRDAGDGCDAECIIERICGNGLLTDDEECDDGNNVANDGCTADCMVEVACGNGVVNEGEECDDGDDNNSDSCDTLCTRNDYNILRGHWTQSGAVAEGPDSVHDFLFFTVDNAAPFTAIHDGDCLPGTKLTLYQVGTPESVAEVLDCADLSADLEPGEYALLITGEVEIHYTISTTLIVPIALDDHLNGVVLAGGDDVYAFTLDVETAIVAGVDDGNTCQGNDTFLYLFQRDGNDFIELEQDDDGGPGLCSNISRTLPAGDYELRVEGFRQRAVEAYVMSLTTAQCGDGVLSDGETCDDGNLDDGDGCTDACELELLCGNGVLTDGEICDDGNLDNADGCDSLCTEERLEMIQGTFTYSGAIPLQQSDFITFSTHAPSQISTQTSDGEGGCRVDTRIRLYRIEAGEREQIASNNDANGTTCSSLIRDIDAGDYELRIDGSVEGPNGPEPIVDYTIDVKLHVNMVTGDDATGGFVRSGNDHFQFEVLDAAFRNLFTSDGQEGCPGDTLMALYTWVDDEWVLLGQDDDSGQSTCSAISQLFEPGLYEVRISGFSARAVPEYVLSIHAPGPPNANSQVSTTEIMQNPVGADSAGGEWFEIHNVDSHAYDLEGLRIWHPAGNNESLVIPRSLILEAYGYVVLGRSANMERNGGVEIDYAYGGAFVLRNTTDSIILESVDGDEIDRVEWDDQGEWPVPNGASMQLSRTRILNHDPANWCESTDPYGNNGNLGTPGTQNNICPDL